MQKAGAIWRNVRTSCRQGVADMRIGITPTVMKRVGWVIATACLIAFTTQIVFDGEYDADIIGEDKSPMAAFGATKLLQGKINRDNLSVDDNAPAFTRGEAKIGQVAQGKVYDCRFLAALASFAASESGKKAIRAMIQKSGGGAYTVRFPGAENEPVTVTPLSKIESQLYAHAYDTAGLQTGNWAGLLEKAYGQYRLQHMDVWERTFKSIRHGILEGRWTAKPYLPGFAASYGARDDDASKLLCGMDMTKYSTLSWELGKFGIGKDAVTMRQIHSWFDRDRVISQFISQQDNALRNFQSKHTIAIATTEAGDDAAQIGLRTNHAYAVIGYDASKQEITLEDPYAKGAFIEPVTNKLVTSDNGVFTMPLMMFNKYFSHLNIAG